MSMTGKGLLRFFPLAATAIMFFATDASAQKKPTVGFSQIGAESSWRTAETNSIRSEAEKREIPLKFSDAQGKQEKQVQDLRAFIAQKVDAIILAPVVETGWE